MIHPLTNSYPDQTATAPVGSDPVAARGGVHRLSQTRGPTLSPDWISETCRANARVNRAMDRVSIGIALFGLSYIALAVLPAFVSGAAS